MKYQFGLIIAVNYRCERHGALICLHTRQIYKTSKVYQENEYRKSVCYSRAY